MDAKNFLEKYVKVGLTAGIVAVGIKLGLEAISKYIGEVPKVIFSTTEINVRSQLQTGVPTTLTSGVFDFLKVGLNPASAVMMIVTAVALVLVAGLAYDAKPIGKTAYWKLTYLLFLAFGVAGTLAFGAANGINIGSMLVMAAVMAFYAAIVAFAMTGLYLLDIPNVKAPALK